MKTQDDIKSKLSKLQGIVDWFEDQEDLDVETGLLKAKEGAVLIKELREKLKKVENEFKEIKEDLENE